MAEAGSGQCKYDLNEDWGKLPSGSSWGRVTGVAVDSQGRVYVCQQLKDPPILVFDKDGNYLSSWGVGAIGEPHTIYIGPDDVFYLADRGDHVVAKLTLGGDPQVVMGNRGQPSDTGCTEDEGIVLRAGGPFNRPTRLCPSPFGDLYVSDGYRNSRVHRFSADGELIHSWGTPGGSAPSEIYSPHSVWVDGEGFVYVCDRKNDRIQIFSPAGEFVNQWADVPGATDIYMVDDETVYVAERQGGSESWITVRNKQGHVLERWASPMAHQIRVDAHGDIYMALSTSVGKYVRK